MLRIFIAGTDTGVGKTQAACALLSLLADRGQRPAPFKPYESGCADLESPKDALELRAAADSDDDLALICPHRFTESLAPGVAAMRLGKTASFDRTQEAFEAFKGRSLVVEGAGGLRVPVDSHREVIDLIRHWRLPAVLVARAGLGTLNHTALSVEALRHRKVPVRAVLLVCATADTDASAEDNARHIERINRVPVLALVPYIARAAARREAFRRALAPLLDEP